MKNPEMTEFGHYFREICVRHLSIAAFFILLGAGLWFIFPPDDGRDGHEPPHRPPDDGETMPKPKMEPEVEDRLKERA